MSDPQQRSDLLQQMSADAEKQVAREVREAMIEMLTVAFDKSTAYANVMMLGGYAGGFTLWAYTNQYLSPEATILVALLLGVSLATFVFFEVFKMVFIHRHTRKQTKLLYSGHPPRVFLERLKVLQREAPQNTFWFMRIWGVVLAICVLTGLAAVGILFYNFFALLLGLPPWPAHGSFVTLSLR